MIGIVVPGQAPNLADFQRATRHFRSDPRFQTYLVADGEAHLEGAKTVQRGPGVHISKWWNLGLEAAESDGCQYIIWFEPEVELSPITAMEMVSYLKYSAGMAGPILNPSPDQTTNIYRNEKVAPMHERLEPCFAFKAGWPHSHADENFKWMCHGADLARRNYDHGGTVLVPGDRSSYYPPLGFFDLDGDQEKTQMVVADLEYFSLKHRSNPW